MISTGSKSILGMAKPELAKHVRGIAKRTPEAIRLSTHTKWERMPERSITLADIARVLQTGNMVREPENGKAADELKCRFDGKDEDGSSIGVELSIRDSRPTLIVITVIRYKK